MSVLIQSLTGPILDLADAPIGGEGIIVEIDESKLGKRKYNRGHRVKGIWVVGGVEITPERCMFAVIVQDRSADTLRAIIQDPWDNCTN